MSTKLADDDPSIVWTAVLDDKYLVQVQRAGPRSAKLVVFLEDVCLLDEDTYLSYGAVFGPDVDDVEAWCKRVQDLIDSPKN